MTALRFALICGIAYGMATHYAWPQNAMPPAQQQVALSDERMAVIVAQQALINARLSVEMDQMRQTVQHLQADLAKEKARADAAEAARDAR